MKKIFVVSLAAISAFNVVAHATDASTAQLPQKKGWDVVLNFLYGQPPFTLEERQKLQNVFKWSKACESSAKQFNRTSNNKDSRITKYNLTDDQFLLQIGCAAGAYQESFLYYLIDDKKEEFKLIQFKIIDFERNKIKIKKTAELVGTPEFQGGKLTVFQKGRGVGGCGSEITYGFKAKQSYVIQAKARSCEEPMDAEGKMADPNNWPVVKIY